MNKYIISLLVLIFSLNAAAQTKPTPVSERMVDGKRMVIYSDGTWKEKEYTKPKIQWVAIPGGTFTMGSPYDQANREDDETPHQVTLSAFKMSKYEITNAQYAAFLNAKNIGSDGKYEAGSYPTEELIYQSRGNYDWGLHYVDGQWVPVAGYENYPVINVTWYGASEFAAYMGCRLPTEAEWEYACRAGTTTHFNTGICLNTTQANYDGNYPMEWCSEGVYRCKTMPVGSFSPNAWGLCDMHGNVWEWCSDWYDEYPIYAQTNPKGPASGTARVFRGGSWYYRARYCRSAYRCSYYPDSNISYSLGFRVVSH
ncbi:MAG: formylglycine-generating enzyme family protein [Bacteroidales bacterium]|nr:formylglycine-generating enzyme family protein [Bacteroidales bacterium]MDD4209385.1 formylglycine-generating enzyme family protein [Bacteroidales bacterium]